MSDSTLRALERAADAAPEDRAAYYAQLAREGRLGRHWAAGLSRVGRIHLGGESILGAELICDFVQDEALMSAAEGRLDEVLTEASAEACRLAREEWAGEPGVFHALAAMVQADLVCARAVVRKALGLKRLPSYATIKGRVYSLKEWELRSESKRMERAQ